MGISLRVRSCCCGTNLRTGAMIIGTIDFIGALATLIVASIGAANTSYYYCWSYWYCERNHMSDLRPMYIVMAVLGGFLLVFDILLLYAVSQTRPKLIFPWILYTCFSLVSNFICVMIYGIYSATYNNDAWGYISICWSIFYVAIKIYFLLVVWSLYQQMKGATPDNGVHVTTYPTVPIGQQPHPNGPQTYPNGQMQYPNVQMQYPNVQMQYPNVQMQYPNQPQHYPNVQQPYPNVQQPYPNVQQPYPHVPPPYPNVQVSYPDPHQPHPIAQPLPTMDEMRRDK